MDAAPHVLVVDDEADVCEVIRTALEEVGAFRVTCAANGNEARLVLKRQPRPDLALIDALMPGEPGLALAARAAELGIPVLLSTGDTVLAERLDGLGCGPVLRKPFRIADLFRRAEETVLRSPGDQQARREARRRLATALREAEAMRSGARAPDLSAVAANQNAGGRHPMMTDREQQVRERAYRIWEEEGQPEGRDQEHWRRAEAEIADEEALSRLASEGGAPSEIPGAVAAATSSKPARSGRRGGARPTAGGR